MDQKAQENLSVEERVARLEGRLGWRRVDYLLSVRDASIASAALFLGAVCSVVGLGFANHWYQIVLAILIVALSYHREWFIPTANKFYAWSLATANVFVISMMLKLVIGSGKRFPFFWALYPKVESGKDAVSEKWVEVMPKIVLNWEQSQLATWSIDLTIIQTFLLMITLFGALFDFQPFVSFTAFLLILVSIPALVGFNWAWVFPAMIFLAIAVYIQSASYQEDF